METDRGGRDDEKDDDWYKPTKGQNDEERAKDDDEEADGIVDCMRSVGHRGGLPGRWSRSVGNGWDELTTTVNMLIMHMLVMHKPNIALTWGCSHCGACQKCRIIAYCILHDPTPPNMHYNGSTNRGGCVHCGLVEVDIMML